MFKLTDNLLHQQFIRNINVYAPIANILFLLVRLSCYIYYSRCYCNRWTALANGILLLWQRNFSPCILRHQYITRTSNVKVTDNCQYIFFFLNIFSYTFVKRSLLSVNYISSRKQQSFVALQTNLNMNLQHHKKTRIFSNKVVNFAQYRLLVDSIWNREFIVRCSEYWRDWTLKKRQRGKKVSYEKKAEQLNHRGMRTTVEIFVRQICTYICACCFSAQSHISL